MKRYPEFAEAYGVARTVQGHRRFDQMWEIAEAATTETAYLAKVRIEAARWQAARLAPTKYGAKPLEGETPEDRRPVFNITVRNFGEAAPAAAGKLAER